MMKKIDAYEMPLYYGTLTALCKEGYVDYYWNLEGYSMEFLFGEKLDNLEEKVIRYIENGAFKDYINAVLEEMLDNEESEKISEIYIRLNGEC